MRAKQPIWNERSRFLVEQHARLGGSAAQLSNLADRYVTLYIALSIGVAGLWTSSVAGLALAAIPIAWSALTFVILRIYREVLTVGGARRAIEEALSSWGVVVLDEGVLVAKHIRRPISTVPYTSMLAIITAGVFSAGVASFHHWVYSYQSISWRSGYWVLYLSICVSLAATLLATTLLTLRTEPRSFTDVYQRLAGYCSSDE